LERSTTGQGGEVPLLGMEQFFDQPLTGGAGLTLREAITQAGGTAIFSRAAAPPDARSGATSHGGFDDDPLTMTSVVMRLLGVAVPERQHDYQAHTPLLESGPPEPDTAPVGAVRSGVEIDDTRAAAAVVFTPSAAANPPGESPLVKTAQPQRGRPVAPAQPHALSLEVAVAPESGRPIVDILEATGWKVEAAGRAGTATKRASRPRPTKKTAPAR